MHRAARQLEDYERRLGLLARYRRLTRGLGEGLEALRGATGEQAQRARAILAVAADNGVDILVLGAFGCGAFRNDPRVVAKAYANVMKDCRRYFNLIEFAIFCRDFETENYDAFAEVLA